MTKDLFMRISSKNLIFLFLTVMLILVAGLRPLEYFRDTSNYLIMIHSYENVLDAEPTFWFINQFNKVFLGGNDQVFFLLYALIAVSLTMFAIIRTSTIPWFSVVVYLCLFFILHEMTQIRVAVAVAFFLLGIPDIANRSFKNYLIKTLLAISFHYSAIIMIPLYFLSPSKKRILFYWVLPIIGFLVAVIPIEIFSFLEYVAVYFPADISSKILVYLSLLKEGHYSEINIFNLFAISMIVIYYFSVFNINKFKNPVDIVLLKLLGVQIFVYYFFSSVPVFSMRLSEFISISLILFLPNLVLWFKERELLVFIVCIYCALYFVKVSLSLLILS